MKGETICSRSHTYYVQGCVQGYVQGYMQGYVEQYVQGTIPYVQGYRVFFFSLVPP